MEYACLSKIGGRKTNEDFIGVTIREDEYCFILCDGVGGHNNGELASRTVADFIGNMFKENGYYDKFLQDTVDRAQNELQSLQKSLDMEEHIKTTLVVLIVTPSIIRWAHIGDSRLYHFYGDDYEYERTKDHSFVQVMVDMGEIKKRDIRTHEQRNKVLRVMGSKWRKKSFEISEEISITGNHAFVLMTDGFWEYIEGDNMKQILVNNSNCKDALKIMEKYVLAKADMTTTDNYSAIVIKA